MWALLSSRLRTWLFLAVAIPVIRRVVARVAAARDRSHPRARSTSALRRADALLARLQSRRSRHR